MQNPYAEAISTGESSSSFTETSLSRMVVIGPSSECDGLGLGIYPFKHTEPIRIAGWALISRPTVELSLRLPEAVQVAVCTCGDVRP
jgi:hypothetical protein